MSESRIDLPIGETPSHDQSREAPKSVKKKIVICCDGTGNDFGPPNPVNGRKHYGGTNSNVIKIYTALTIDNEQVAYYHPGVGTMGAPSATHWYTRKWTMIKGLAFGAGFRDNVLDAYRYLMDVYNDNGGEGNQDEIYVFGFSRGAYTARALVGLLHGYGLLCRGNEGHLPYAWRMYVDQHLDPKKQKAQYLEPDEAFKQTYSHQNFVVHFLGVWDTVSSVGWITTPLQLFNLAQNSTIKIVRHAISIDERRCFFQDNLFGPPADGQHLLQAWFAGVHSDVGGSYSQPDSGLADIALRWMMAEAEKAHIRFDKDDRKKIVLGERVSGTKYPQLLYEEPITPIAERYKSTLHNSLTFSWWPLELIPHIYYSKDFSTQQRRVPLGIRRRQIPAGALVHKSVVDRLNDKLLNYNPRNITKEEVVVQTDIRAADNTYYHRFDPINRKATGLFFSFVDRFVLTWLISALDILVLLPFILWLLMFVVAGALVLLFRLLRAIGDRLPPWKFCIWHALVGTGHAITYWFCSLASGLHHALQWVEHVKLP